MNSKTNRTLFIIIALFGSVQNSHANSNQLAIRGIHTRKPIKEVKTFESPNPFAVLSALDGEFANLGSLSDESSANKRSSQEEENLNIPAEETHLTETQSDESKWLGMSSAKKIPKRLAGFAALVLLRGVQAIPKQCLNNSSLLSCYNKGCDDGYSQSRQLYNNEYNEGLALGYIFCGGVLGCGLLWCGIRYYRYYKTLKEQIEIERSDQVDEV